LGKEGEDEVEKETQRCLQIRKGKDAEPQCFLGRGREMAITGEALNTRHA
jgi:hypothetical protein